MFQDHQSNPNNHPTKEKKMQTIEIDKNKGPSEQIKHCYTHTHTHTLWSSQVNTVVNLDKNKNKVITQISFHQISIR